MITWPVQRPTLIDGNLTLRPWSMDDVSTVYQICQDPVIALYTTVPVPYTEFHARVFIENQDDNFDRHDSMAFAGVVNGEVVLCVSLHSVKEFDHLCELGYWVAAQARGEGYASRAATLASNFALSIGFRRVEAFTDPDNEASRRTLIRAGFQMESILPQRMTRRDGTQTDAIMFSKFAASGLTGKQ